MLRQTQLLTTKMESFQYLRDGNTLNQDLSGNVYWAPAVAHADNP